jgi:hypothetical protein
MAPTWVHLIRTIPRFPEVPELPRTPTSYGGNPSTIKSIDETLSSFNIQGYGNSTFDTLTLNTCFYFYVHVASVFSPFSLSKITTPQSLEVLNSQTPEGSTITRWCIKYRGKDRWVPSTQPAIRPSEYVLGGMTCSKGKDDMWPHQWVTCVNSNGHIGSKKIMNQGDTWHVECGYTSP